MHARFGRTLALAAGMLLVHCSSRVGGGGAADGSVSTDAAKRADSSHSSHAASSGSGAGSVDAGEDVRVIVGTGDTDASCAPPEGGPPCTPGFVQCGDAGCSVPESLCCVAPSTAICQPTTAACSTAHVECEEKGDCADGEICCLSLQTMDNTTAVASCQPGPVCPTAKVASAQLCRSNNECPGGACQFWICPLRAIESCTNPNATFCMPP